MKKVENSLRSIYDIVNDFSKNRIFPENPVYMDVELSNLCNMDCIFCQRQQMGRATGNMTIEEFKELVKQSKDAGIKAIRFVGWGEPFMNKNILDMAKLVKDAGLKTHITTNGLLINDEIVDRILGIGLDSIIFSMQGLTEEEYSKQRNTDKFNILKSNIIKLIEERNKRNLDRPFVQIMTSVTNEIREEINKFKEEWGKIVDLVTYSRTWLKRLENKDRVKELLDRSTELPMPKICNEVRYKLSIHWNGNVSACCEDYDDSLILGNFKKTPLKEIWKAKHSKALRTLLNTGNQNMFVLCRGCELTQPYRGGKDK